MLKLEFHGEWLTKHFFDLNLVFFNTVTACVPIALAVILSIFRFARLWADSNKALKKGDKVEVLDCPDMFETTIGTIVSGSFTPPQLVQQ